MNKIFRFDLKGAYIIIIALAPGFLMMSTAFFGLDTQRELILGIGSGLVVLLIVLLSLARGTYVLFHHDSHTLRSSRFFFVKAIKFSCITKLKAKSTFGGVITELRIEYKNESGKVMNTILMAKQSFREEEFCEFIRTLRTSCPSITIPKNLLTGVNVNGDRDN